MHMGTYAPDVQDETRQQLEAYKRMDEDELFFIEEVFVDMPGPTRFKAVCAKCKTVIRDKREVLKNNEILCRPCAYGTYYQPVRGKGEKNVRKNSIYAL